MISLLLTVGSFLVVLTVIVFVHEMGHYLVARWNGVAVQTFSIGFGGEIVGFNDRHGTRWRISAIPLGGYVRFVGDMNPAGTVLDRDLIDSASPELQERLFVNKNVWQRIAVVVAGPAANVILTFLILYGLFLGYGRYTVAPVIGEVLPDSVAASAGLQPGDRVESVDGFSVRSFDDFTRFIQTAPEHQVSIVVDRNGTDRTIALTPEAGEISDQFGTHRVGKIGVSRSVSRDDITLYRPNPVEAVGMTVDEIRFTIVRTAAFIGDFFVGRGNPKELGGPVKVAQVSGEVATLGFAAFINLIAMLSLNIGLFNLLPVPMLDGGHLLFYLVEAARGRPLSARLQEMGFRVGLALVLTLTVFTVVNDIFNPL